MAWAVQTGELLHRAQGPYNYKQECPQPAFRSGRALLTISLFLRKCTPTHTQTTSAHPLVHKQSVHTHSYTTSAHPRLHNQYTPMVTQSVHTHTYNLCPPMCTISTHSHTQRQLRAVRKPEGTYQIHVHSRATFTAVCIVCNPHNTLSGTDTCTWMS